MKPTSLQHKADLLKAIAETSCYKTVVLLVMQHITSKFMIKYFIVSDLSSLLSLKFEKVYQMSGL